MFAKTSFIHYKPGTFAQAEHFAKEIMFPSASTQQGFRGALMLRHDVEAGKYIAISFWDSKEAIAASGPPPEILAELEKYAEHIAEAEQEIYEVIFQLERPHITP